MRSLRLLVADDEPLAADRLRQSVSAIDGAEVVGVAKDGREALDLIDSLRPDLVLLDIQMPVMSGVEVAREVARKGGPEVVFVTAFADFATEAFELDAVDYLLKPYRSDRLEETLRRARRRLEEPAAPSAPAPPADDAAGKLFWVPQRDGLVSVHVQDIERIEAARDYALLFTRKRSYLLRITMTELERRLDPKELVRVHRSAFVRPEAVLRAERREHSPFRLHMRDGAMVDVGPSYVKRISEALALPGARARA